ncbi:uncharacterized protein J4E88_006660 [Alternaria novae-zelandiae]|uniref:uncharacterized protein n=1 Tax=Alternaria novae-zelandiae TaxID=430562 RepID=UPI0020C574F3|nr:uncharacterized protein J4E88_006660 [Alternaria novae-zelandiae]KAI4678140.1 hypothetical protein J4E88_006660 [Alternaria novae-zelandiae]
MAATPIVVDGKIEENMDTNSWKGWTKSQQSDTSKSETPEGAPPMPLSRSLDSLMGTQGVLPSQSEQLSTLAVPTPTDGQGSTRQAFAAPSLSMNATSTFSLNFVASTIRPTLTVQADAIAMNEAMTIQPASTAVPGLLADSFAQDEIAALPGVNQDDPSLRTVPGMNQEFDCTVNNFGDDSRKAHAWEESTEAYDGCFCSVIHDSERLPLNGYVNYVVFFGSEHSHQILCEFFLPAANIGHLDFIPNSVLDNDKAFIATSTEGKEDIQPSTQTIMAPQAITTRQSVSSGLRTLSLASGSALPSSLATAVSVEPQHGLTPLARTLFILFGVLGEYRITSLQDESNMNTGFVTILLAIGVTLIMRSNRRRAQAARQQAAGSPIKDIEEYDGYGNITRVSANSSIKNFLTEPEKAIVNRAATPDGDPDVSILHPQTRYNDADMPLQASTRPPNTLTEAINSFITKSRRLTYKISP